MSEDRLSTLLTERAEGARRVHPTMAGVEAVVALRSERRHRQRVIGGAAIALIVVACLGAALAMSRAGEDSSPPVTAPEPGTLPDLPAVGLEVDGFVQDEPQIDDLHLDDEPARTVVVFRSGRSLADPFVTVAVQPPIDGVAPEVRGDPTVDVDDDGVADASIGGNDSGMGIEWRLTDGSVAMVGAELVDAESEDALITYAGEVFSPTLDLDDLPSPAGLPERETWTLPDPRGPDEARVSYEAGNDSERRITVSTTNQPGYFDLLQDSSANPADGFGFEEIALGPSFLGSGQAIVFDEYAGPGRNYALIRTDTGLTLEITTEGLDAGILRDVIRTGAFVDVGPSSAPTTTVVPPPTTAIVADSDTGVASSGTGGGPVSLVGLRVEPYSDELAQVIVEFEGGIPPWEATLGASQQPAGEGNCALAQPAADTWLNIVLGVPGGGGVDDSQLVAGAFDDLDDDNPTFSGITATLTCELFEGAARVDVSLPDPIPRPEEIRVREVAGINGAPDQLVLLVHL